MVFETFLKDLRKSLGVSQKTLTERTKTTYQNISSYERNRTECTFDIGMGLLNALGVSVIIENNQIILKGEYDNMSKEMNNKKYERQDLDFINFNSVDAYSEYKSRIADNEKTSEEQLTKAFKKLEEAGYEFYTTRFFMDRLWDADHYPVGEYLVSISKGDREIRLLTYGGVDIDIFIFEEFISDIKKKSPKRRSIYRESFII